MSMRSISGALVRAVRALVALVVLLVLLLGVPAALWALQGSPLPDHLPTATELSGLFTTSDTTGALLKVLSWFGWLGWVAFAVSVVVECGAALRGRTAPELPGLVGQRVASMLIATIIAAMPTASAFAATTAPGTAPAGPAGRAPVAAATAPMTVDGHQHGAGHARTTPVRTVTYEVQPGDYLGSIAEAQLGDFSRWPEIAKLNLDHRQADGRALDNSHWVYPGWVLQLPGDARTASPAPAKAPSVRQHVVRPGETLSGIAAAELGDSSKAGAIAAASAHIAQPDGAHLTDPDLIRPGWTVDLPGAARHAPTAAAGPTHTPAHHPTAHHAPEHPTAHPAPTAAPAAPAPAAAAPAAHSPAPAQAPRHSKVDEPTVSHPAGHPGAAQPSAAAEQPAGTPRGDERAPVTVDPLQRSVVAPAHDSSSEHDSSDESERPAISARIAAESGLGIGAVLAGGLLALYASKRARQLRSRRAGHRIPVPDELSAVELEARVLEEPDTSQLLNLGVRTLAQALASTGTPAPTLRGARLTGDALELFLAAPRPAPPAPFTRGADDTVWVLHASATGALIDAAAATRVPAPYPTLVTIGKDADGAAVLLDMESISALTLVGSAEDAQEVLAAIALELAVSDCADDMAVHLVGWGKQLAQVVNADKLHYADDLDSVLDTLEDHVRESRELLDEDDVRDVPTARATKTASATWTPVVVLCATAPTPDQRARLSDLVPAVPRLSLAVAVSVADASRALPASLLISVTGTRSRIELLDIDVEMQRVRPEQARKLLSWLAPANEAPTADAVIDLRELPDEVDGLVPASLAAGDDAGDGGDGDGGTGDGEGTAAGVELAAEHVDDAADTPVAEAHVLDVNAPQICFLGPMLVKNARGELDDYTKRVKHCTALALYMALFPGRGRTAISEDIWNESDHAKNMGNRNSTMRRLRKWFGKNDQGEDYVPMVKQDRYLMLSSVNTDWHQFKALAGRGRAANNVADLEAALSLVRGKPFENSDLLTDFARWTEPVDLEARQLIADVAHLVAQHRLDQSDVTGAIAAISLGLNVNPYDQSLRADLIDVAAHTSNREGLDKAIREFYDWLGGEPPTPETISLLERVRESRRQAV